MRCGHLYYSGHNQCLLCVRSHMHDRMPRPVYGERHTLIQRRRSHYIIIRPSSLGGGRTLRRTLSVCLSVRLSVRPVSGCCFVILYSRIVLRANIQNRKTSVFAYGPASRMYFSARTEGRISYGHLGRTNLFMIVMLVKKILSSI